MKKTLLALTILGIANCLHAGVTLQFSEPYLGAIPSNFANGAGAVTNGMRWGIIVSTADATFAGSGTSYDAYVAGSSTAGFLSFSGGVTDDYFIPGTLTLDASGLGLQEGDFATVPGNGSIVDDLIIATLGVNGLTAGDKFALTWFGSAGNGSASGDKYGFLTDASFVIPADGNVTGFSTPFTGVDAPRTASNTFVAGAGPVPEPSRMMLLGFGLVGLFFRRRR
jgi:hypothetical protein